jgi:hypothetical protein
VYKEAPGEDRSAPDPWSRVREKIESRGICEDHLEEIVVEEYHPTQFRKAREGGLVLLGRDRGGP